MRFCLLTPFYYQFLGLRPMDQQYTPTILNCWLHLDIRQYGEIARHRVRSAHTSGFKSRIAHILAALNRIFGNGARKSEELGRVQHPEGG